MLNFGWAKLIVTTTLLLSLVVKGDECTNPTLRKEVRELTRTELDDYINAVKSLQNTRRSDEELSIFEELSKLHSNSNSYIHNDPSFLLWHREFIHKYEMELRKFKPGLIMPYWDWTLDYEFPHESKVLSNYMFGGNGDYNNDSCLMNGPFANTKLQFADDQGPHCLRRIYNNDYNITSFVPPEVMVTTMSEPRFSYYSFSMEVLHGYPHDGVGGQGGDFGSMYSPQDPLFYLHHSFVDMLFSKWQEKFPSAKYEGAKYKSKGRVDSEELYNMGITVKDAWNTTGTRYCYQYPAYPRVISNPDYTLSDSEKHSLSTSELSTNRLYEMPRDITKSFDNIPKKIERGANEPLDIFPARSRRSRTLGHLKKNYATKLDKLLTNNPFLSDDIESNLTGGHQVAINHLRKKKRGRARKKARKPKKIRNRWLEMNRLDPKDVEEVHSKTLEVLDTLNELEGFISLADAIKLD